MKYCRGCNQSIPTVEFNKRLASPDGLGYRCKACCKSYRLSRGTAVYKKLRRESYERNRSFEKAKALGYYHKNRTHCLNRLFEYKNNNIEKLREYRRANRATISARVAEYRAALSNRTPIWLTAGDFEAIENFYVRREQLQKKTGREYHVDHIIPLRGKNVSGLHVPSNLQILEASENLSKGNKYVV